MHDRMLLCHTFQPQHACQSFEQRVREVAKAAHRRFEGSSIHSIVMHTHPSGIQGRIFSDGPRTTWTVGSWGDILRVEDECGKRSTSTRAILYHS